MAATTAVKSGPVEGEKVHFRTQMVNGKPQIYFDALDESPIKSKPKRNSRAVNNLNPARLPEQQKPKSTSHKSLSNNIPHKQTTKTKKVSINEDGSALGVFMTMDEISELVKAVKAQNNTTTTEIKEMPPPPPPQQQVPQQQQQVPQQQQQYNEIPRLDLYPQPPPPLAPISPRQEALGMMADKKRQKWMREKAEMDRMKLEVEYDQLKHQLSPHHLKASSSPERSTFPLDYASVNKPPLPPPSINKQNDYQQDNSQNDIFKTRLMEKKQQQWKQENADKAPLWNPFGRPGAGAPNANELQTRTSQPPSNIVMPYRPPDNSFVSPNIVLNDQTRVPAAMRTNLLFGDVRFEDDVKTAKEIERRQWLDDLQKQIEENKRQKFTQQETERRQDFLHENIQPLVQEAANRHQQQKESSPIPISNTLVTNNTGQDLSKSNRHDSVVRQTYDKIVEATELAKYEKKAQLIEKLKRNGHRTDLLAKTLPDVKSTVPESTQKTNEKNYDSSPKKNTTVRVEPLHLNAGNDHQQSYRTNDAARRDEAVNTIDSTFRSDNSAQTDLRMVPPKQMFSYTREESDLPPQIPNHLFRHSKQNKKNVRIRSLEDHQRQRRSSMTTTQSNNNTNDDGATSQLGTHRSNYGPTDLLHRPLWNYQNPEYREYVPNSKRDPHYDKRQRPRHTESGHTNRTDDIQKKTTTRNGWNSDSEVQQERKEKKLNSTNRTRSTTLKPSNHKDENLTNLFKGQTKQETYMRTKSDDELHFNNISSLDKYEHFVPYTRTDEVLDPSKAFSPIPQSRETSAHKQRSGMVTYDDHHRRQNASIQPPPYHVPPSRQQHILQQLTAIKENLVRRQQEVATSMNAIPV